MKTLSQWTFWKTVTRVQEFKQELLGESSCPFPCPFSRESLKCSIESGPRHSPTLMEFSLPTSEGILAILNFHSTCRGRSGELGKTCFQYWGEWEASK